MSGADGIAPGPEPASDPGGGAHTFLSAGGGDDDDLDLEALSSKACALASVPVPDYTESIRLENDKYKKKYGNRFTIEDDDDDDDDDGVEDNDASGMALAKRTSQILSNFQDYVNGIGGEAAGSAGKEILEGKGGGGAAGLAKDVGGKASVASMASNIRSDNKNRLIGGSTDPEGGREGGIQRGNSHGSGGRAPTLQREWAYEGYAASEGGGSGSGGGGSAGRNLHDVGASSVASWEDDLDESGMIARGQRYTHPLLQSRRVKIGVLNLILVSAIVLGVSLGVSRRNSNPKNELSNMVEELEEEIAQGKGELTPANDEMGPRPHVNIPYEVVPAGAPSLYADDVVPAITKEEMYTYENAMAKWRPKMYSRDKGWSGKSYLDAYEFCSQRVVEDGLGPNATFDICPYEAICPLGPDHQPVGGYKEGHRSGSGLPISTWVPISDRPNDWIQTSRDNSCVRYSSENKYAPEWGVSGDEDPESTGHVMCCLSVEMILNEDADAINTMGIEASLGLDGSDPNFELYQKTVEKYLPLEFDRSRGWSGKTYIEALQHCGRMNGYEVCPYEAICPLGPDEAPLGGTKREIKGSWAPILDSANDWVQIGAENSCVKFSSQHGKPPSWSIAGTQEELTRHLLCCLFSAGREDDSAPPGGGAAAPGRDPSTPSGLNSETAAKVKAQAEMMAYEHVENEYLPLVYGRAKGWSGRTYAQAHYFCGEIQGYGICPYHVICPLGPDREPLGGYRMGADQAWMPISDNINDWVQVSDSNPCLKFSGENPEPPSWGVTGNGSEGFTQNIMCCRRGESKTDIGTESLQDVYDKEVKYRDAAVQYMPVDFDRKKGWIGRTFSDAVIFCGQRDSRSLCPYEGLCPMGPGREPLGGYKDEGPEGTWIPILSKQHTNEWVKASQEDACILWSNEHPNGPEWGLTGEGNEEITRHITCCKYNTQDESAFDVGASEITQTDAEEIIEDTKDPEEEAFKEDVLKFEPIIYDRSDGWLGQTYLDAIVFCSSNEGIICPFQAICPMGAAGDPLGGYKDGGGEKIQQDAWTPISDDSNDWVNLSPDNSCTRYTAAFSQNPEWGMSGEGNEAVTRNIFCCKGSIWGGAEEGFMYEIAADKFHPVWYSREDGWTGGTYDEAIAFCGQRSSGLCSYEAHCPMSELDVPLGGMKFEPEETWAPLSDGYNQWVSVGPDHACQLYDIVEGEPPLWGVTGDGSEGLTRHIMCCELQDNVEIGTASKNEEEVMGAVVTEGAMVENAFEVAISKFKPVRYGRSDGWSGSNYLDAIRFCGSKGERHEICPYEAVCPMGASSPQPIGFEKNPDGPTWIPISDDSNDWVNLSDEHTCVRYSSVSSVEPEWGEIGGNVEMTANVYCCEGSIWGNGEESFMYELATQKYHPSWFDRESGYSGITYDDAVEFCFSQHSYLCPADALCPISSYDVPLGGVKWPSESWAPFSDSYNAWISIGVDNTCQIYEAVHGEAPDWDTIKGNGNEDLTQHVMCCNYNKDGEETQEGAAILIPSTPQTTPLVTPEPSLKPMPSPAREPSRTPSKAPTPTPTPPPTQLPSKMPTPLPSNTPTRDPTPKPSNKPALPSISGAMGTTVEAYKMAEKFNPVWYGRSDGWIGQSYDDAFEFCLSKGSNHDICPYEVICPAGPLGIPFGGSRTEPSSTWAPLNLPFNSWVQVGTNQVCVRYENLNPKKHPDWGLTGTGNEELTRHVLCCDMKHAEDVLNTDGGIPEAYGKVVENYAPKWFNRSEGWGGNTYFDSLVFCASKDSYIPCPFEAYCPLGGGSIPSGGYDGTEEAWAAIMDAPNNWVRIGSIEKDSISNSCIKYNSLHGSPPLWGLNADAKEDLTPHIMCCKEPRNNFIASMDESMSLAIAGSKEEQKVLDEWHPVWFGKKHGYHGSTHKDAVAFCEAIGGMVLCPKSAYCPLDTGNKLFLQKEPFEGDQWAPASSENGMDYWVAIGSSHETLCATHEESLLQQPNIALDGGQSELREHVLCCQNPQKIRKEQSLKNDLNPIWMDSTHGWKGGSHNDAIKFCESFGNRSLCPYSAYCPHGPGAPVMGGHAVDFNTDGEQWAPVFGQHNNHWVMIGQKYQNSATTCMDSKELDGAGPSWGTSNEKSEIKKYIMCCSIE